MANIFREPLTIIQGLGVTVVPNDTELKGETSEQITISIGSNVDTNGNAVFGTLTPTNEQFQINQYLIKPNELTGSISLLGNTTSPSLTVGGNMSVSDTTTAQKIKVGNVFDYLSFDGLTNEVTTNFSGSGATPLNKTYSWWMNSSETANNKGVFGYGAGLKEAFSINQSQSSMGKPLIKFANHMYKYFMTPDHEEQGGGTSGNSDSGASEGTAHISAQDDGQWHHWMLFNGASDPQSASLYIDGVEQDTAKFANTGTLTNQGDSLSIGTVDSGTTTGEHFSGHIKEFSVFPGDKTGNASTYFNSGSPYDVTNESDLQGYWKMNEGSGSTVVDSSGEGNHGTIDGAYWSGQLSVTIFESGSSIFGDTSDDTHQFSGSFSTSGSLRLNDYTIRGVSNDTSLTDGSSTDLVTEKAVKSYLDTNDDDTIPVYFRKSFAHTGSFVSSTTSSFTAVTASAPTGFTSTSENDFMFFINGQLMEHDGISVQQNGSSLAVHIDEDSIGYDLTNDDEVVAWGKFNS